MKAKTWLVITSLLALLALSGCGNGNPPPCYAGQVQVHIGPTTSTETWCYWPWHLW